MGKEIEYASPLLQTLSETALESTCEVLFRKDDYFTMLKLNMALRGEFELEDRLALIRRVDEIEWEVNAKCDNIRPNMEGKKEQFFDYDVEKYKAMIMALENSETPEMIFQVYMVFMSSLPYRGSKPEDDAQEEPAEAHTSH